MIELERERHPVDLEDEPRLADLGREQVGEVGDEVFGQPGVHLLVGEDGLPGRLVDDVVAELEAVGHERLGLRLDLRARDADLSR